MGCREKFRSCPRLSKEEQTLKKGRRFHLHKEGTLWPWSLLENILSPLEKRGLLPYLFEKTKVMNQTIAFQSRVLFLVSGFQKKKMQEKIDTYFVKDQSIIPVRWRILLHFHSFLTMWKQLIFKISNGTWLPRCF